MQLETTRLIIRDFTAADFAAVYAYGSDPEVVRFMPIPPSTPDRTRAFLARCQTLAHEQPRRWYDLGLVRKATGELFGGITLHVFDPEQREAAFAYLLNRSAWGQGYATEALWELLRFGFTVLDLDRIGDSCAVANTASARVMEKCGLRCEREADGERWYAITAAEWYVQVNAAPSYRAGGLPTHPERDEQH